MIIRNINNLKLCLYDYLGKRKVDLHKEKIIRFEKLIPLKKTPLDHKDIFIVKLTIHKFRKIIFTHQ